MSNVSTFFGNTFLRTARARRATLAFSKPLRRAAPPMRSSATSKQHRRSPHQHLSVTRSVLSRGLTTGPANTVSRPSLGCPSSTTLLSAYTLMTSLTMSIRQLPWRCSITSAQASSWYKRRLIRPSKVFLSCRRNSCLASRAHPRFTRLSRRWERRLIWKSWSRTPTLIPTSTQGSSTCAARLPS